MRKRDLTQGRILPSILWFAFPMILGNILQQIYNIVDTLIVGRFIGANALAAVGSSYTLMTFLTSIIIGLCMGSGALYSFDFGANDHKMLKKDIWQSFLFITGVTIFIYFTIYIGCDGILHFQRVPMEIYSMMKNYCLIVFAGIGFIFLFNFFAYILRSIGNSMTPLIFLGISSIINIILDLLFVIHYSLGVEGAALATVLSQAISGIGISIYVLIKYEQFRPKKEYIQLDQKRMMKIIRNDFFTCMQQSVMNFGILLIQGLVNSFGPIIMAAFATGVKIDTLAYTPSQEFSNAYSLFISQNHGAKKLDRIKKGTKYSIFTSMVFCIVLSLCIFTFAKPLMTIFVDESEVLIIQEGIRYLHVEGVCYIGIGWLFILYAYFRGIGKPQFSLVLTIVSLGTRVVLAYMLAPYFGVTMIWLAIPIGWGLADIVGFMKMRKDSL